MRILFKKNISPGITGRFFFRKAFPMPLLVFIAISLIFTNPVHPEIFTVPPSLVAQKDFGDSLFYEQYTHPLTGPFHLVRVKLTSEKWCVKPAINPHGVTKAGTVSELALASNPDAVCAINASFFDPGNYPVGTVAISGNIMTLDNRKRSTIGIKSSGKAVMRIIKPRAFVTPDDYFEPIWIWGYNHPATGDSIMAYNILWETDHVTLPKDGAGVIIENGKVTSIVESGICAIPNDGLVLLFRGDSKEHLARFKVGCNVTLGVTMPEEWEGVSDMVTGGPRLIENGRVVDLKVHREGLASSFFKPHQRSITGFTWNNEFFFALFPNPVTYEQLASVLLDLNVRDAIGLDGGSSSTLWVKGEKSINGSKEVPVALVVVPRDKENSSYTPIPFYKDGFRYQ